MNQSVVLPPELWARILEDCLLFGFGDFHSASSNLYLAVDMPKNRYYFSGVCRSWRGLIMSTPVLWSRIAIDFDTEEDAFPSKWRSAMRITKQCLDLSRDHTLEVDLFIRVTLTRSLFRGEVLSFMEFFFQSSNRWISLEFLQFPYQDPYGDIFPIIDSMKGRLGQLRRLGLYVPENHDNWPKLAAFKDLPSLEYLRSDSEGDIDVCCPNIRRIETSNPLLFCTVLSTASRAETARIYSNLDCPAGSLDPLSVRNDNLKSLTLPPDMLAGYETFDCKFPALAQLTYERVQGAIYPNVFNGTDNEVYHLHFQERGIEHLVTLVSQCQLSSLNISLARPQFHTTRSPALCELLQTNLSSLTHLELVESVSPDSQIADLHFTLLQSHQGPSFLLPKLVHLKYHLHTVSLPVGPSFPAYDLVLELVESRSLVGTDHPVTKLEQFYMHITGSQKEFPTRFRSDIEKLEHSGLILRLTAG